MKPLFPIICLILLLNGCSEKKEPNQDPVLKEAFAIHQKSVGKYKELALQWDSLNARFHTSTARPDSLFLINLDSQIVAWAEAFSEVPGFEDYKNHHLDHQHGPSLIKDLPSAEILLNQKEHASSLDSLFLIVNKLKSSYLSDD